MENNERVIDMITYAHTTEKPRLEINYDDCSESPREWCGNIGYFTTVDNNYNSPDDEFVDIVKDTANMANSREHHMDLIKKEIYEYNNENVIFIIPIVKYEHGAISYSMGARDGFDYSNNGFYIVTDESLKSSGVDIIESDYSKLENEIQSEIDTYNKYVNNDVYRFTLYDEDGVIVDSCGGFYEVESIREHLPDEFKDEDLNEYVKTDY